MTEKPDESDACYCGGKEKNFKFHGPRGCGVTEAAADWAASPGAGIEVGAHKRPKVDKGESL